MDHEIAVPPGQIADYIATRTEGLENSRTAQVGIPVYKLNGIIAHLRALDQLHRGENVDLLTPPKYEPEPHRLIKVADVDKARLLIGAGNESEIEAIRQGNINMAWHILNEDVLGNARPGAVDPALDGRAGAIGECEAFLNCILINREFSYSIKPGTDWQRLPFGPVTRIDADALAYAIDIESAGDGWVRQSESMPGTITYEAGMAVEFDALPEPIKQAISRLEMHRSCIGADTALPDVVTSLLRPYRRMRLS